MKEKEGYFFNLTLLYPSAVKLVRLISLGEVIKVRKKKREAEVFQTTKPRVRHQTNVGQQKKRKKLAVLASFNLAWLT